MDLFDYYKKTGQMQVVKSVEDYEKFEKEFTKLPKMHIKANAAMHRTNIKKGLSEFGEKLDSFAEYTFSTYMRKVKNATVERNIKEVCLTYIDENNKTRKYYPDFIVNGTLCEVKGRYTAKDRCKHDQHPEVTWYFQEDINTMRAELNQKFPGWRDGFTQTNIC